jgi:transcriptional regulator with XRE-family HTH domain
MLDYKFDCATRIRELREKHGVSSKALAITLGITQSFMSALETGKKKCSLRHIELICETLGISLSEFFNVGGNILEQFPSDIKSFILDPKNHGLIKMIQELIKNGYSQEAIGEAIEIVIRLIEDIENKYNIKKIQGQIIIHDDTREEYENSEMDHLRGTLDEAYNDPGFAPPPVKQTKPKVLK